MILHMPGSDTYGDVFFHSEASFAEIWAGQFAALAENAVHLRTWNEAVKHLAGALGADAADGTASRAEKAARAEKTSRTRTTPPRKVTPRTTSAGEASGFTVISISGTDGSSE
jgi:hypothetical protein